MVLDPKEIKELRFITLRQDLKKLLTEYGFIALAIAEYVGVSDRAIREFVNKKRKSLTSYNFNLLNEWTTKVLEEIEKLEDDPIKNLTDKEKEELETWLHNKKVNNALMKILGHHD